MKVHKLTAGDGYTYLTRQVAAADATERGRSELAAYYSEKGEAPGTWTGRGLGSLLDFPNADPARSLLGTEVSEGQMRALFGEGRHPNAREIERASAAAGASDRDVDRSSRLGAPFRIYPEANEFRARCRDAYAERNAADGLPRDWPVTADVRAAIRTRIARQMFDETYGRDPLDARELSSHLARISRQATTAVAGYDLTFSPVKSVSTLWAIAPLAVSRVIEQAHADTVADTLAWLEDHATYTRRGRNGVAQVDVTGLIAAAFTHRDSRAGDPDLHTHVAISNKVRALDGSWLALDGQAIYKNNVAASERYNTRLEALLTERLGVRFADREPDGRTGVKHPIREIVGIDGDLPRAWSKRRAHIDVRRGQLSAEFQDRHGRPPTAKEAGELAQQATLETRQSKHEPRSYADQRAAWRAEAIAVLGDEIKLRAYLNGALHPARRLRRGANAPNRPSRTWVRRAAAAVLDQVQAERAVWQETHVRAEAERQVRAASIRPAHLDVAVDAVVAAALHPELSVPLDTRPPAGGTQTPQALRRRDGSSVYSVAGSRLYTSTAVLDAELAILAATAQRGGRTLTEPQVDLALLESIANGVELNPGQAGLVRELACSGARVQLALAPAGTGKTTALRVLSAAWTHSGGTVIGLAPSAAAAAVLREELHAHTDTVAKLLHDLGTGRPIPASDRLAGIGSGTLIIVDEAGMAATTDLNKVIAFALGRGASVRLVGDDQQLAAIGAGGILRDIAHTHGAATLSQIMRFVHPAGHPHAGAANHAEAAASLALRDGDPAAIGYYLDQHRVHVGDLPTCADHAYVAWRTDRAAGRDALLLAPTRDLVAELNTRARADRLATAPTTAPGPVVRLADGLDASAGDTVISRHNERTIPVSASDWVKNGDRWHVEAVLPGGALQVRQLRTRRRISLPAGYVREYVELGYATTIHGAQGVSAETCHTVASGSESRQLFYVAMTRGRAGNHVYLATGGDADPHATITRDVLLPPTAAEILTWILARDDAPVSVTSTGRNLADPAAALHQAADLYADALTTAAATVIGPERLTALDATAGKAVAGLTDANAYPALRDHLVLRTVSGEDPEALLARAIADTRGLTDARDPAAVLDWRLHTLDTKQRAPVGAGPLSWLPDIPAALADNHTWGTYLRAATDDVHALAERVATAARQWTPADSPTWARPLFDCPDSELVAELAVWRAATGVPDTDLRPTGPSQLPADPARAQRHLDQRIAHAVGDPHTAATTWTRLAQDIDPRITADPYWPVLAGRLDTADRAGIDVPTLVMSVAAAGPLPDEQPAAALWWRLSGRLEPAAAALPAVTTVKPDWTRHLEHLLGEQSAAHTLVDPGWPGLVAAVATGTSAGWQPAKLLDAAYDLLRGGQPDAGPGVDHYLRPGELVPALTWRICLLTDPDPIPTTASTPWRHSAADDDEDRADALPALDDAWLTSLPEPSANEPAQPDDAAVDLEPPADLHRDRRATRRQQPESGNGRGVVWIVDAGKTSSSRGGLFEYPSAAVPRERIVELNQAAADFYTDQYLGSWAPGYLADRLHLPADHDQQIAGFRFGYAPDAWTDLTDHLHTAGAADRELLAAGLSRYTTTGRLIDVFRDRLIFPITATTAEGVAEIHGFIARRNPVHEADRPGDRGRYGPKYLNTAETELFIKGRELFGAAEARRLLDSGATPVLAEGPMDAIAVTLAGQGRYVGLAPMGTRLTDDQADQIIPSAAGAGRPPKVVVATDADHAGIQAAHRAYWQLARRGGDPRRLVLPDGKDPADLLHHHGDRALRVALDTSPSLAGTLIDAVIDAHADRLDTVEGIIATTRRCAELVAAQPPENWAQHLTRIVARTGVYVDIVSDETFTAHDAWLSDPVTVAARHASRQLPPPRKTTPSSRWAPLVNNIDPRLTTDPGWPSLAATLDQAAATGYNVATGLSVLVAQRHLPADHPARVLELRILDAHPSAARNDRTIPVSRPTHIDGHTSPAPRTGRERPERIEQPRSTRALRTPTRAATPRAPDRGPSHPHR